MKDKSLKQTTRPQREELGKPDVDAPEAAVVIKKQRKLKEQ